MNYRRLYNRLVCNYGRLLAKTSLGGWSPFPLLANCIITYDCNLTCPFCFADKDWDRQAVAHLDAEQWQAIFRQIPTRTIINFSGGEVFCHPQFFDLLHKASANHCVTLATNGTMLNESTARDLVAFGANRLGKNGLLQIGVSINEQIHDAEDARKILDKKMALLAMLDHERTRQNKRGLNLDLKVLIREETAAHLPLFADAVENAFPDTITFQMMFLFNLTCFMNIDPSDKPRINELYNYKFQAARKLGFTKMDELQASLSSLQKLPTRQRRRICFLPDLKANEYLEHYADASHVADFHCYSPWTQIMINPQGIAYQCLNPQGIDLQTTSFSFAWNSTGFREFRRHPAVGRPFPICAGCCFLSH